MIAKNDLKEDEEKKEQNNIENEKNENINDKREEIYNSLKSDPQNYSKINQYNNTQTILGHSEKVTHLIQLESGKLASGSYDKTIRIWDASDKSKAEAEKIIQEDGYVLSLLEFEKNKI